MERKMMNYWDAKKLQDDRDNRKPWHSRIRRLGFKKDWMRMTSSCLQDVFKRANELGCAISRCDNTRTGNTTYFLGVYEVRTSDDPWITCTIVRT